MIIIIIIIIIIITIVTAVTTWNVSNQVRQLVQGGYLEHYRESPRSSAVAGAFFIYLAS